MDNQNKRKALNMTSLREKLWEVLHKVEEGELEVSEAKSIVDISENILESVKLEKEVMQMMINHQIKDLYVSPFLNNTLSIESESQISKENGTVDFS